jgi:hypothetical protein
MNILERQRLPMQLAPTAERLGDVRLVELGSTEEIKLKEARCLRAICLAAKRAGQKARFPESAWVGVRHSAGSLSSLRL